jgi:hypothetical protein
MLVIGTTPSVPGTHVVAHDAPQFSGAASWESPKSATLSSVS